MALTCATSVGDGHKHSSKIAVVVDGDWLSLMLSICHPTEEGILLGWRSGNGSVLSGKGEPAAGDRALED